MNEFTETNPRPLENTWTEKGWSHELVRRDGRKVIVRKIWLASGFESWEVAILKVQKPYQFPTGFVAPWRESYPASERWGERGWTCQTLEAANKRMESVNLGVRGSPRTGFDA